MMPGYSQWWEQQRDKCAANEVRAFYRHWKKREWTQRQAYSAFQDLVRKVTWWVGAERAKEMLP